jgi:hypothetical protein
MDDLLLQVKTKFPEFTTQIDAISRSRKILLALKKSPSKKMPSAREFIHWYILNRLISRPTEVMKMRKIVHTAQKKGTRIPLSLYADILATLDDNELVSVFMAISKKPPEWLSPSSEELKSATRIYSELPLKRRDKVASKIKQKCQTKGITMDKLNLKSLMVKGADYIDFGGILRHGKVLAVKDFKNIDISSKEFLEYIIDNHIQFSIPSLKDIEEMHIYGEIPEVVEAIQSNEIGWPIVSWGKHGKLIQLESSYGMEEENKVLCHRVKVLNKY